MKSDPVATEQVKSKVQMQLEPKSGSKPDPEVNDDVDLKETATFEFRFRFGIRWRRIATEMDRSQMVQLTLKKIMVMKPRGENGSDGGGGSQREEESDFY
ncbi:hypothetical protein P8452_76315 [Trifolium repens]|jgi:hypothetical protein|nr:hypothetical protein P8452_76315 [Trifolium repens]